MSKPLVIYHGNCDDGFGAAWAIWRRLRGAVDYFAAVYGNPPPDVSGRDVIMVDVSFKRPIMDTIIANCRSLTFLDHHKSAREDLAGLIDDLPAGWKSSDDIWCEDGRKVAGGFDMNHSGAMMAWKWFNENEEAPNLIKYVEDRDLWRFSLPNTNEYSLALRSYPMDFKVWDELSHRAPSQLIHEGIVIKRFYDRKVEELVGYAYEDVIGGHLVPVCNAPWSFASDLANVLCKGKPFAASWYEQGDRITFSLRSDDNGLDVSAIAVKMGGGGHEHAAGFRIMKPTAST